MTITTCVILPDGPDRPTSCLDEPANGPACDSGAAHPATKPAARKSARYLIQARPFQELTRARAIFRSNVRRNLSIRPRRALAQGGCRSSMRGSRLQLQTALIAACGLSACSANSAPGTPLPPSAAIAPRMRAHSGSNRIQHIVIMIQENRSFDDLFATYPGADGATSGYYLKKVKGSTGGRKSRSKNKPSSAWT